MPRYLIIGNGVAGTTGAESIRKQDKTGAITIITAEALPYYSRIRLPEYIAGEVRESDLVIKKEQWYADNNISLLPDTLVDKIDLDNKTAITRGGDSLSFDKLLLATGGKSFIPPIQGSGLANVFALRDVSDARAIKARAKKSENVVVIGGGVLGLEAGNALVKLDKKVTVVEFMPRLLPRQTDIECAKRLQRLLEKMGFLFRLDARTKEIAGDTQVKNVLLEGGENLPADMILISAGVRPVMDLALSAGLTCDKAIVVDDHMQTSKEDVFAAGDVIEFEGRPYGIWPAASDQGKIAGTNMAGGDVSYAGTPMSNTLKVAGVELSSAGDIDPENKFESSLFSDEKTYKKVVFKDNRIVGCIMLGDKKGFVQITRAMARKKDVSMVKDKILSHGFDFAQLT